MNAQKPKIAVVVPTYEEAENLPHLAKRVDAALTQDQRPYEMIIVDDNSPDDTEAVVSQLKEQGYPLRLIVRTEERGLSSAVIRGFEESPDVNIRVCMDADLSHPPESIPALCREIEEDEKTEIVVGSRYVEGGKTDESWGLFRKLNSKVATALARPFTRVKDPMAGFFAIQRRALARAKDLNPCGYKILLELIVKSGARRVREVPIHFRDRVYGESKMTFEEQLNYLRHVKRLLDYKYKSLSQFLQFAMIGSSGMVIDLLVFSLLMSLTLPLAASRAVAIWLAMSWNFWFNRQITFNLSRKEKLLPQYGRFALSCSAGAAISWSISVGLAHYVEFFNSWPIAAAAIGIVFGTVSNFVLSKFWVFGARGTPVPAKPSRDRTWQPTS